MSYTKGLSQLALIRPHDFTLGSFFGMEVVGRLYHAPAPLWENLYEARALRIRDCAGMRGRRWRTVSRSRSVDSV